MLFFANSLLKYNLKPKQLLPSYNSAIALKVMSEINQKKLNPTRKLTLIERADVKRKKNQVLADAKKAQTKQDKAIAKQAKTLQQKEKGKGSLRLPALISFLLFLQNVIFNSNTIYLIWYYTFV